jgi:MerR family transcriptional regulator, light-induced transcriptional regulator
VLEIPGMSANTSTSSASSPREPATTGRRATAGEHKRATVATLFERTVSSHTLAVETSQEQSAAARARTILPADVHSFVALVLGAEEAAPGAYLRRLLDEGVPTTAIYLDLLTPTAVRLGELWEADDCDFVDVTIGLGRMQRTLHDISQVFAPSIDRPSPTGSALLTCIAGEQHTLGIVMIADALLRDGWRVQVGAPWSDVDLATMVRSESFDVLGVSLACESRIPQLRREVAALRAASSNSALRILVGGQAFVGRPDLVKRVDADAFAETLAQIVPVARQLLLAPAR